MTNFHGKFIWYELMTTDMKGAEDFYCGVIGWSTRDSGLTTMSYTLFSVGETTVAGLMAIPEQAAGARPGWIGYLAVEDVDLCAESVVQSGGTICHAPDDIPQVGRFAVVTDSQGVVFGLFTPIIGQQREPLEPKTQGRASWHELHAVDGPSAFGFYEKLFGWTKGDALDMGQMGIYQLFNHDDVMVGGMMTKMAAEAPPHWLFYFNVDEINAAADRVKSGGGQIINGPHEVPGGSLILQCLDPQGALFALVEPRGP